MDTRVIVVAVALAVLCISPIAMGGLDLIGAKETITTLDIKWGWNPEVADTESWDGQWWDVTDLSMTEEFFQMELAGWSVDIDWTHVPIHTGEGLYTKSANGQFWLADYGLVINEQGAHTGSSHHPGNWKFEVIRGNAPADTVIRLTDTHVPEPLSLSLLAVGGLALLRRKR